MEIMGRLSKICYPAGFARDCKLRETDESMLPIAEDIAGDRPLNMSTKVEYL